MAGPELVVDGQRVRLHVFDLGLACCALEVVAAAARPAGPVLAEAPDAVDVLVVSGTVTHLMAPAVRRVWERLTEPRRVLSYGACANSGGPYWDSYAVVPGVDTLIPVDVYVPGCPPRPEALLDGLRELVA